MHRPPASDPVDLTRLMGTGMPVHPLLLGADVLIVESLCGLGTLGLGRAYFAFVPLRLEGLDGSPIRALGWRV